jgi:ParB-like chromosome segregation protein Spo0J
MSKSKTSSPAVDRGLEVERVEVSTLLNDPANVRKHNERNLESIKASLARFGQQKPIVVGRDGVVIAGNGTLAAARSLGWSMIDIVRSHLTGAEATAYAIADNRTAELAEWDDDALAQQLAALQIEDEELLAVTGFDEKELEAMSGPAEVEEDEVPEPPVDPITKPGDLWILGEHRLLCGDSTKAEDVERLMAGAKAAAMITDPPFGISYKSNMDGDLPRSIAGDNDTKARDCALGMFDDKFPIACFATWHCVPPRKPRGMLIWKKNVGGMGDLTFPWSLDYEVVWIFGSGWSGHRGSSVLEGETICTWNTGPAARIHPHQKPVRVISQLIEKSAGLVFDPFLGSGTTLIAAEQLGRKCYGMEISPAYCDVIVKRWETLTGKKAERGA